MRGGDGCDCMEPGTCQRGLMESETGATVGGLTIESRPGWPLDPKKSAYFLKT